MTARYAHLKPENFKAVRVLDDEPGHDLVTEAKKKGA